MLDATQKHILDELARATAAADPRFARRMAAGPYGRTAARWRIALVVVGLVLAVATDAAVAGAGLVAGLALVAGAAVTVGLVVTLARPQLRVRSSW